MVISLNRSYESKVVAVLSSDSRFLRSATVRTDHPHCYSTIRTEIRTASVHHPHSATVRPHYARTFPVLPAAASRSVRLHRYPCFCTDFDEKLIISFFHWRASIKSIYVLCSAISQTVCPYSALFFGFLHFSSFSAS